MWYTHITFGLFLGLLSLRFVSPAFPALYLFLVSLAALLPDVDHPHSLINKKITLTRWASHLFTHRGFFHSIFPAILLYILVIPLNRDVAIALSLGYLSHILIDGSTKKGVNLLHPVAALRIQGFIETGGIAEWAVFGTLCAGIAFFFL